MSRESLRIAYYLQHIVQDAVIRNFEIIGEASNSILKSNEGFIEQHPDLPLRFAYDMRNQLSHGYFSTDLNIVWRTATRNIPALGEKIKLLVEDLRAGDANHA
jgi:uncharacterized protein with HEPN domain